MTTTKAELLTIGTRIIPTGKKRPVTIAAIFDRAASVELYLESPQGTSVAIYGRRDMIETLPPKWTA